MDSSCGLSLAGERAMRAVFCCGKWTLAVDCGMQMNVLCELCSTVVSEL